MIVLQSAIYAVIAAVLLKIQVFWVVTPCRLVKHIGISKKRRTFTQRVRGSTGRNGQKPWTQIFDLFYDDSIHLQFTEDRKVLFYSLLFHHHLHHHHHHHNLLLLCLIPYGLSRWITSRRVTLVTYHLPVLLSARHTRNISAFICNNECINLLCPWPRGIPASAAVRHVFLNNALEFCVSPQTISYTTLRRWTAPPQVWKGGGTLSWKPTWNMCFRVLKRQ